jgi:hypothetical protein
MKKLITIVTLLSLTGCGVIAKVYDQADDCQTGSNVSRPQGYKAPAWCGASSGRTVIYNNQNQRIGYIK